MHCPHCKQEISRPSKVCEWCGRRIDPASMPAESSEEAAASMPRLPDAGPPRGDAREADKPGDSAPQMPTIDDLDIGEARKTEEPSPATIESSSPEVPRIADYGDENIELKAPDPPGVEITHQEKPAEMQHLPSDDSVEGKEEQFVGEIYAPPSEATSPPAGDEGPSVPRLPESGPVKHEDTPLPHFRSDDTDEGAGPFPHPPAPTDLRGQIEEAKTFFRGEQIRKALKTDPLMVAVFAIVAYRAVMALMHLAGLNIPGASCFCDILAIASFFGLLSWRFWAWWLILLDNGLAGVVFIFAFIGFLLAPSPGALTIALLLAPSALVFFVLLSRKDYFD